MSLVDSRFEIPVYTLQYAAPPEGIKASARHILVKTEDEVTTVIDQLEGGASFADMARQFSTCPSGAQGGSLGSFSPGTMVAEFDNVIFAPETELGKVVGPVKTQVCQLAYMFLNLQVMYKNNVLSNKRLYFSLSVLVWLPSDRRG